MTGESSELRVTELARYDATPGTTALALGGVEVPGRPGGWRATVELGNHTIHASRPDGEDRWVTDALYRRGLPVFVNGLGSVLSRPVGGEIGQLLEEALENETTGGGET